MYFRHRFIRHIVSVATIAFAISVALIGDPKPTLHLVGLTLLTSYFVLSVQFLPWALARLKRRKWSAKRVEVAFYILHLLPFALFMVSVFSRIEGCDYKSCAAGEEFLLFTPIWLLLAFVSMRRVRKDFLE